MPQVTQYRALFGLIILQVLLISVGLISSCHYNQVRHAQLQKIDEEQTILKEQLDRLENAVKDNQETAKPKLQRNGPKK